MMQFQSINDNEECHENVYVYIGPDELVTQRKSLFLLTIVRPSTTVYDGAAAAASLSRFVLRRCNRMVVDSTAAN